MGDSKKVHPEEMIIDRGEAEVDNHFGRVNIITNTLSEMYYLFYHAEIIECICPRRLSQHFGITVQKYGNNVASFWCNVMVLFLTSIISECQTAQTVLIWFQIDRFNLLKKTCDEKAF